MQTIGNDLNAKEIDIFNDSLQSMKDKLHARFLKIICPRMMSQMLCNFLLLFLNYFLFIYENINGHTLCYQSSIQFDQFIDPTT